MNWLSKVSGGLSRGFALLSPTCKEATRLQSQAMERSLSVSERVGLKIHLFLCKWCRRYGAQIRFLRSAAHQCEEHEKGVVPQKLSPEARERILRKVKSAQE